MRLEIRRPGVKVTEALRAYVKERLRLALGRFTRHFDVVRVYLRDVNGPRGGLGEKCRMVVELPPRGRVIVSEADTAVAGAIARTASRAAIAVKRHVKRCRARRRPRTRHTGWRAEHEWRHRYESGEQFPAYVGPVCRLRQVENAASLFVAAASRGKASASAPAVGNPAESGGLNDSNAFV